ncbi:uncharacterized protein SCHCODRAFT_02640844 [Schizophyllum commune H4-8]|uniref:uncharacterized protein n=1 Tax=Schizophyllum commune (strain H4-8 / FGSC 9210) TaxID=578458 RepID=UPI00215FD30A|nr:uncharacterized protein SCHCODRAFT_02640844 [Schizophyllum commune H4-8]KAI5887144.1 hypothetical protein SCHCODRAFT_02640844 [Schizophyllum commune H4-8]
MALGGCCGLSPPCSQWLAASCTKPSNLSTRAARQIWRRSELSKPPRYAKSAQELQIPNDNASLLSSTSPIAAATVL